MNAIANINIKKEEVQITKLQIIGMITLFTMIVVDYLLTYIGMYEYFMITEGNPFMVWLMNLPLSHGLAVRVTMASLFVLMIHFLISSGHKHANRVLIYCIAINLVPLFGHFIWWYTHEFMLWSVPDGTAMSLKNIFTFMFTGSI